MPRRGRTLRFTALLMLFSAARAFAAPCSALDGHEIPAEAIGLSTSGAVVETVEAADGYCSVKGAIRPVSYTAPDIHFQVNLPEGWNGRVLHFGGGGFNGQLVTGLEHYVKQPESEATPLEQGYVTFGSDSGHQSEAPFDGSFLLNEEALRNFGHEQIKKTHDVALALVRERYGRAPDYVYFAGGSQGGHEAFDAVQRYPQDYDGVLAGYPAHNMLMLHLSANRYAQALENAWIDPKRAAHFVGQIYSVCDPLDGLEDGIISNVAACYEATASFRSVDDDNPVRCGEAADDLCLSDKQVETLLVMDQPYDLGFSIYPDDQQATVFPRWTPFEGSTFVDGGFDNLGSRGPEQALQRLPGDATPRYAISRDLNLDAMNGFEPGRYAGRIADLAGQLTANSTNLEAFRARGGKMILFHGTVDDFIPVYSSIEYFERLEQRFGAAALDQFVRFYLVPGMGHVTGPFNARISSLDALAAWVEKGHAPHNLTATDSSGRSRPVCRYPEWPAYRGKGSADAAKSFACRE